MLPTISMGQYLFKRVSELGVEHIFGVPGDFNRQCHPPQPIRSLVDISQSRFWMNSSKSRDSTGSGFAMNSMELMQRMGIQELKAFQVSW